MKHFYFSKSIKTKADSVIFNTTKRDVSKKNS